MTRAKRNRNGSSSGINSIEQECLNQVASFAVEVARLKAQLRLAGGNVDAVSAGQAGHVEQEYAAQISAVAMENARLRAQLRLSGEEIARLTREGASTGQQKIAEAAAAVVRSQAKGVHSRQRNTKSKLQ